MAKQRIPSRYLKMVVLVTFLNALFGPSTYNVQRRNDEYMLDIPRRLNTEETSLLSTIAEDSDIERENGELQKYVLRIKKSSSVQRKSQQTSQPTPADKFILPHRLSLLRHDSTSVVLPPTSIKSSGIKISQQEWRDATYKDEIASGKTSKVFAFTGRLLSKSSPADEGNFKKFAIKCLRGTRTPKHFMNEFKALERAQLLNHPNIVEMLSAFQDEFQSESRFNFVFPLALGNLSRLLNGEYDRNKVIKHHIPSLWSQVVGLSSAVAYLHDSTHTAHRDIKPSNILIYFEPEVGALSLKLADFGLAVDLTDILPKQEKSTTRTSADAGNSRSSKPTSSDRSNERNSERSQSPPSPQHVFAGDIWNLGCVFTELVVFLVSNTAGLLRFRDSIVTTEENVTSDEFSRIQLPENRFDEEEVKPEVLDSIKEASLKDQRVAQLQPILCNMLANESDRPDARTVCQFLTDRTDLIEFPYTDGVRRVRLSSENGTGVTHSDRLRIAIEKFTGNPVDWWPLAPVNYPCPEGGLHVHWQYGDEKLTLLMSKEEGRRYRERCISALSNGHPILPTQNPQTQQPAVNPVSAPAQGSLASTVAGASPVPAWWQSTLSLLRRGKQTSRPNHVATPLKEIYWCMDELYSDPREITRRPIRIDVAVNDEQFYDETNRALRRGIKRRLRDLFSWKACVGVRFNKFRIVQTGSDEVLLKDIELPPQSNSDYEHGIAFGILEDEVLFLCKEIVRGIRRPKTGRRKASVVYKLPKKRLPPEFQKVSGVYGWGLYAEMGFAVRKIFAWFMFCCLVVLVFAIWWLVCISSTDLQNATVPATIVLSMVSFFMAAAQLLG